MITALLLYRLYNFIYTALALPAGRRADHMTGAAPIALAFVLFAVVDLFLLSTGGLLPSILAFVAAGVQAGFQGVIESAWVARNVPPERSGAAFGQLGMIQGASVLAGSLLIGGLWTYISAPVAFGVSALLCRAGAALLLPLTLAPTGRGSPPSAAG